MRTRTVALATLALLALLAPGCKSGGTAEKGTEAPPDKAGPATLAALKDHLVADHSNATWFPAIANIEEEQVGGVTALLIEVKTPNEADADYTKDDAIISAIRDAGTPYTPCFITYDEWGERTSRGVAQRPPLADAPKPANAGELKAWLAKQYGPGGPRDCSAEPWYGTIGEMRVDQMNDQQVLVVKTTLKGAGKDHVYEHLALGALGSSHFDFVEWVIVQRADGSSDGMSTNTWSLPFDE